MKILYASFLLVARFWGELVLADTCVPGVPNLGGVEVPFSSCSAFTYQSQCNSYRGCRWMGSYCGTVSSDTCYQLSSSSNDCTKCKNCKWLYGGPQGTSFAMQNSGTGFGGDCASPAPAPTRPPTAFPTRPPTNFPTRPPTNFPTNLPAGSTTTTTTTAGSPHDAAVSAFCSRIQLPAQAANAEYDSSYKPGACYGGLTDGQCRCFTGDKDKCTSMASCIYTNSGYCIRGISGHCDKTAISVYSSDRCLQYPDCQYNPPPPPGRCEGKRGFCGSSCPNMYTCTSKTNNDCNTFMGVTACTSSSSCSSNGRDCANIDEYSTCQKYNDCNWIEDKTTNSRNSGSFDYARCLTVVWSASVALLSVYLL